MTQQNLNVWLAEEMLENVSILSSATAESSTINISTAKPELASLNMAEEEDNTNFARGVVLAVLLSLPFWLALTVILAL